MIALAIALATIALGTAAVVAWMLGARAGRSARARLETRATAIAARLAEVTTRAERAERELAQARDAIERAREQRHELGAQLTTWQHAARAAELAAEEAKTALARATKQQAAQTAEIADLRARLDAERAAGHRHDARTVAEVQRVLGPLLERERLASDLARLDVGRGTRGELPQIMDALARIGGFSSVVLADEVGLPLAVNTGAENGDQLAGMWSMLLAVADRVVLSGAPAPHAIVVHDAANQTSLHRLFTANTNRFVLTAVSRGRSLSPEVLDPALGKLERILAGTTLSDAPARAHG